MNCRAKAYIGQEVSGGGALKSVFPMVTIWKTTFCCFIYHSISQYFHVSLKISPKTTFKNNRTA